MFKFDDPYFVGCLILMALSTDIYPFSENFSCHVLLINISVKESTREWKMLKIFLFYLTHWGCHKIAAIFQTTFSNAFSWTKMYKFLLRFHWSLFPWVQLTLFLHWFRQWLGAGQPTSHYLDQWWLVYWRIYASLSLNEFTHFASGNAVWWHRTLPIFIQEMAFCMMTPSQLLNQCWLAIYEVIYDICLSAVLQGIYKMLMTHAAHVCLEITCPNFLLKANVSVICIW